MVDAIFDHFIIIGQNPAVDLGEVIVHDVFITLDDDIAADVGFRAPIDIPERLGGSVDDEVEQVTLFLQGDVRHVGSELLYLLENVALKVREASANHSQQVQGGRPAGLNLVVLEVVIEEELRFVVEHFQDGLVDPQVGHDQLFQQLAHVVDKELLHLRPQNYALEVLQAVEYYAVIFLVLSCVRA